MMVNSDGIILDVIVVGAGPAGLSAALQLRRRAFTVRVFEASRPGGLLWNANLVENYPGVPGGVSGPRLAKAFIEQSRSAGIEITPETVTLLDWNGGMFTARTASAAYSSSAAVIASGTVPKRLEGIMMPGSISGRILYDIVPIAEAEDKKIVIAGAGDAAFDYALNLGKNNDVVILGRREKPKCLPVLRERVLSARRINFLSSSKIISVGKSIDGTVDIVIDGPNGELSLNADYLLVAAGRIPVMDFCSKRLIESSPELERRCLLRLAGDVKNGSCRQAAIAAGDGIRAGMEISPAEGEG